MWFAWAGERSTAHGLPGRLAEMGVARSGREFIPARAGNDTVSRCSVSAPGRRIDSLKRILAYHVQRTPTEGTIGSDRVSLRTNSGS